MTSVLVKRHAATTIPALRWSTSINNRPWVLWVWSPPADAWRPVFRAKSYNTLAGLRADCRDDGLRVALLPDGRTPRSPIGAA